MVTDTTSQDRVNQHAKLLRYDNRQALAFLSRDESGALTIIVQLWCAREDHQLRVAIGVEACADTVIEDAFADLNEESLALTLDHLGVRDTLASLERG